IVFYHNWDKPTVTLRIYEVLKEPLQLQKNHYFLLIFYMQVALSYRHTYGKTVLTLEYLHYLDSYVTSQLIDLFFIPFIMLYFYIIINQIIYRHIHIFSNDY